MAHARAIPSRSGPRRDAIIGHMTELEAREPIVSPAAALAKRAGVDRAFVDQLIDGEVLTPGANGGFSEGDLRRDPARP